jgi:hypothetical protein
VADGLYRRLYEKQRLLAEDAFVNPGEDPIPDVEHRLAEPDVSEDVGSLSRRL